MAGAGIGPVALGPARTRGSHGSVAVAVVVAALVLAAVTGGVLVAGRSGGTGGSAVAAERIDPLPPLAEIRTQGDAAPAQPWTAPLADPAVGNTAVAAVLADLQEFWAAQDAADPVPGLPAFRPPSGGYVALDSTDPADGTALCVTDAGDLVGNAYYCPGDDGIVFDSAALVPVLIGHYGTAALAVAIAHEFGHAVQDRVGGSPADGASSDGARAPAILVEAQADCHAGAFLAWAADGNSRAGTNSRVVAAARRLPGDGLSRRGGPAPGPPDRARPRPGPDVVPAHRVSRRRRRVPRAAPGHPAADARPVRGGHR